jgi:hypothetical protein
VTEQHPTPSTATKAAVMTKVMRIDRCEPMSRAGRRQSLRWTSFEGEADRVAGAVAAVEFAAAQDGAGPALATEHL